MHCIVHCKNSKWNIERVEADVWQMHFHNSVINLWPHSRLKGSTACTFPTAFVFIFSLSMTKSADNLGACSAYFYFNFAKCHCAKVNYASRNRIFYALSKRCRGALFFTVEETLISNIDDRAVHRELPWNCRRNSNYIPGNELLCSRNASHPACLQVLLQIYAKFFNKPGPTAVAVRRSSSSFHSLSFELLFSWRVTPPRLLVGFVT